MVLSILCIHVVDTEGSTTTISMLDVEKRFKSVEKKSRSCHVRIHWLGSFGMEFTLRRRLINLFLIILLAVHFQAH